MGNTVQLLQQDGSNITKYRSASGGAPNALVIGEFIERELERVKTGRRTRQPTLTWQ